jgi:hypothetical protein
VWRRRRRTWRHASAFHGEEQREDGRCSPGARDHGPSCKHVTQEAGRSPALQEWKRLITTRRRT